MKITRRNLMKTAAISGASIPLSANATNLLDQQPTNPYANKIGEPVSIIDSLGRVYSGAIEEVSQLNFKGDDRRPLSTPSCATIVRFKVDLPLSHNEIIENELFRVNHSKIGDLNLMMTQVPDLQGTYGLEAVFN